MDPQKALHELLQAIVEEDWDTAHDRATALEEWLDRGGFAPEVFKGGLNTLMKFVKLATKPPKIIVQVESGSVLDVLFEATFPQSVEVRDYDGDPEEEDEHGEYAHRIFDCY